MAHIVYSWRCGKCGMSGESYSFPYHMYHSGKYVRTEDKRMDSYRDHYLECPHCKNGMHIYSRLCSISGDRFSETCSACGAGSQVSGANMCWKCHESFHERATEESESDSYSTGCFIAFVVMIIVLVLVFVKSCG